MTHRRVQEALFIKSTSHVVSNPQHNATGNGRYCSSPSSLLCGRVMTDKKRRLPNGNIAHSTAVRLR